MLEKENLGYNRRGDKMVCKKCGASLPNHGFLCTFCGSMMDKEQIKFQKELLNAKNPNKKADFITERYGKKGVLFQKREEKEKTSYCIFFLMALFLCFLLFLVVFSFI